jgi:hypothetical protein
MLRLSAALFCGLILAGCTTWVNIPAQRGDMASHDPNNATVREVVAAALKHAIVEGVAPAPYAIELPRYTRASTYQKVLASLPVGGMPLPEATEASLPVFRIKQIQVRGLTAQVDLIPPPVEGSAQLMTVYLKGDVHGWYATRSHLWRMPVIDALRMSRPMPAPGTAPIPHRNYEPEKVDESPVAPEPATTTAKPTATAPAPAE